MKIYDITVPIRSAMPVYQGDPGVKIDAWSAFAKGDSSNVSMLNFGAHTGTHVDAPAHFIEGGGRIDALSLNVLIGPARVIRVPDDLTEIEPEFIGRCDLRGVERVLFHTRNSRFWNEGFRQDFTHLLPEAAQMLVDLEIKLVGTDEGLDLSAVAAGDYELICLPLKIAEGAGDGAPARAVLRSM